MDALEDAMRDGLTRHLLHGVFFGRATATQARGAEEAIRTRLAARSRGRTQWQLLTGGQTDVYSPLQFMYAQDGTLFAELFAVAFGGTDQWRAQLQRMQSAVHIASLEGLPFVLSKTEANMSWHVDGGARSTTDIVVYFVLGPTDAVSVVRIFGIDLVRHAAREAQEDGNVPSEQRLRQRLAAFDNKLDVVPVPSDTRAGIHKLDVLPSEVASVFEGDAVLGPYADCVTCWQISARSGDVLVFDGSQLHSVHNIASTASPLQPQLALAVNFRRLAPRLVRRALARRPTLRFHDACVRCDECNVVLDDEVHGTVVDSQECTAGCDTWACLDCAESALPAEWACRRHR